MSDINFQGNFGDLINIRSNQIFSSEPLCLNQTSLFSGGWFQVLREPQSDLKLVGFGCFSRFSGAPPKVPTKDICSGFSDKNNCATCYTVQLV